MTPDEFDLFNQPIRHYPDDPGHQKTDTSLAAAESMDDCAETLRAQCLVIVQHGDCTADEAAASMECSVLAIRPRFTELRRKGKIHDSGVRRKNDSGKSAIVWSVNPS